MNGPSPAPFKQQMRSAIFEVAMRPPEQAPRRVLCTVALLIAILCIWAFFAKLDIVAVAEGRLVPQTYVKIVQPSEAGIVREILVTEGDDVVEGQVLIRLDPTDNTADRTAIEYELAMNELQIRRVDAESRGASLERDAADDPQLFEQILAVSTVNRQAFLDALGQERATHQRAEHELTAARNVLEKLQRALPSYERAAEAYERLASDRLVGQLQAEERRRDAFERRQDAESQLAMVASLEAAVAQSVQRMAQLRSDYARNLQGTRMEAMARVKQLVQTGSKLQFRGAHLELRAPQAGRVKDLATTTVGTVVAPGAVLLSLVPVAEPLVAEVSIQNDDIGFVRVGQRVRLKLATYQFQKYGMLDGKVENISADSSAQAARDVEPQAREPASFKARIALAQQGLMLGDQRLPLTAGMKLSAEIVQGKRTALEYLISPMQRVGSEAFSER